MAARAHAQTPSVRLRVAGRHRLCALLCRLLGRATGCRRVPDTQPDASACALEVEGRGRSAVWHMLAASCESCDPASPLLRLAPPRSGLPSTAPTTTLAQQEPQARRAMRAQSIHLCTQHVHTQTHSCMLSDMQMCMHTHMFRCMYMHMSVCVMHVHAQMTMMCPGPSG